MKNPKEGGPKMMSGGATATTISGGGRITIGGGTAGPITSLLRDELVGIQYGRKPDRYGWMHRLA